ncbi:MAG: NAD-dependent epimerase/dehydratase family protein [Rhodospirillales bacterium]|nr:NAD-dependent epimerase/dehydratase family protein [Rhodospirillales bacterium]
MFVVLGGSGFIGTNLRNRLAELHIHSTLVSRGTEATCGTQAPVDNFMALNEFEGPAGDKLIKKASVIVYLAGASVPSTFADEPWRDIDANISLAARTFWRVAQINPTARIVYLSSGGTIYGDQPGLLTSEKTLAEPKSGYGLSKLLIEEALRFVGRVTGGSYAILRVSNPIGPHQTNKAQGIVSLALRAALEGGTIKLFDEGRQVRDYIDVRDVVDSIIAASETEIGQGTWNIGSGIGRSTAEMIKMVEETTQRKVRVELLPKRLVDVSYIVLDISLAREELNWSPSRPISDAVESAYRWLMPK